MLRIEDTPEGAALANSIGIFLGFSHSVGFHTLAGVRVAFLFGSLICAVLLALVAYPLSSRWIKFYRSDKK